MALVPPYIESLRPYQPGRQIEEIRRLYGLDEVIKLASNENPLGPSPRALDAVRQNLHSVHLYPDGGLALRTRIASLYECDIANVIVGSGSEGIISNIIRTFLLDDDEVLTSKATFAAFEILAQSRGITYRTVPHRDYHLDLPALAAAINDRTKIVYLANPNNPTGTIFTRHEFDEFYKHVPERVLIISDEAYFEYARDNPKYPDSLHYRYDNVITLRTFSKAYGLAGLRIGYGFAHERLVANLLKVKLTFEPAATALAAAEAALDDVEFLHRTLALNARALRFLGEHLSRMGLRTVPSAANFIMVEFASAEQAEAVNEGLLRHGIIVRPLAQFGLPHCLRISTGTDHQMRRCVEAIEAVLTPAGLARQPG